MLALLFIIVALGVILETVSLRRDPKKVEPDCRLSAQVTEPGASFKVQTVITNASRIPVSYLAIHEIAPAAGELPEGMAYLTKHDGLHTRKICRLGGRQCKKLTFETSIKKRGVHSFKLDSIEFGDFLGFREFSIQASLRREIVVYPEKLVSRSLVEALGRFCGDAAAKRFLIRDPILTVGSREYTGREPMKEIHWFQSAHRGELMVREFDYNKKLSVCVIMSVEGIGILDADGLDRCCAAARSICEALVGMGITVNFFSSAHLTGKSGKDVWKCAVSADNQTELLEGLGRVSAYACGALEKLLAYAMRENDPDAAFIVILPAGDKHGEDAAIRLRGDTGQDVLVIIADSLYPACTDKVRSCSVIS